MQRTLRGGFTAAPFSFGATDPASGHVSSFSRRIRARVLQNNERSPDGAQRNPGTMVQLARPIPDYAALHPGYEERKTGSGTPTDACVMIRIERMRRPPPNLPKA
jgi:hypothetical protein